MSGEVPEADRLRLRPYSLDDERALYEVFADPYARTFYPEMADSHNVRAWIEWNLRNYDEFGFGLFNWRGHALGRGFIRLRLGLGIIHCFFEGNGALDQRLSREFKKAERKKCGDEAREHAAQEQFSCHLISYQRTNGFSVRIGFTSWRSHPPVFGALVAGEAQKMAGIVHEFMHIHAAKHGCSPLLKANKIDAKQEQQAREDHAGQVRVRRSGGGEGKDEPEDRGCPHVVRCAQARSAEQMVTMAEQDLVRRGQIKPGDVLGVVAGTRQASGSTNLMRLHVVTEQEAERIVHPPKSARKH